jgi:hypothetical protein
MAGRKTPAAIRRKTPAPIRRKSQTLATTASLEPPTARHRHRVALAVVAALTYAPALHNQYTLDDHAEAIVDLAQAPFSTLFDRTYFQRYDQDTYRPVSTLSSMIGHRLGADPLVAGHVQNALWHAGNTVLVTVLAGRMLAPGPALFASLVFAVHPAASEAALSIGFREDLIVCFFALASLLLTLRGGRGPRLAALAAYALALFAKENAIVLPALLVLTRLTVARHGPVDRRALARELAGYLVVTAGYLVVRFGVMASPRSFADPAGGTYGATIVAVPRIFAHYVKLLVLPWPLMVLYAHIFPIGEPVIGQLPWLALDVAVLAGAVRLARTRPPLGLGLLWFAVALAPVLHLVPMRVAAADRFLYLSMVGGAIAAGAVLDMALAAAHQPAQRRMVWAGAGATLLVLLVLTEQRVKVWHDDVSLWTDTLRHNRNAYMGHYVIGANLDERGQFEPARRELEAALADCPRESIFGRQRFCAPYAVAVGFARIKTHDIRAAREAFALSFEYVADNVPGIVGLGYIDMLEGNIGEARRKADRATRLSATIDHNTEALAQFRALLDRAERERAAVGASGLTQVTAGVRPQAVGVE